MSSRVICTRCGALAPRDGTCLECGNTHGEARRLARRRRSGRNLATWSQLVAAAIARDGACVDCGSTRDLTGGHIRYPALTLRDVKTQCRSCNSSDGATRQHASRCA